MRVQCAKQPFLQNINALMEWVCASRRMVEVRYLHMLCPVTQVLLPSSSSSTAVASRTTLLHYVAPHPQFWCRFPFPNTIPWHSIYVLCSGSCWCCFPLLICCSYCHPSVWDCFWLIGSTNFCRVFLGLLLFLNSKTEDPNGCSQVS